MSLGDPEDLAHDNVDTVGEGYSYSDELRGRNNPPGVNAIGELDDCLSVIPPTA